MTGGGIAGVTGSGVLELVAGSGVAEASDR